MGWDCGEGCPLSSRLGGLGSVVSVVRPKTDFDCILKATEGSFLYLYDKNVRVTVCTSVPTTPNPGGTCPPVIYAHG